MQRLNCFKTFFIKGGLPDPSMAGVNGGRTGSVMVPPFSIFGGSPFHVAENTVRRHTPNFMQNDIKTEILKRQYISMSKVTFLLRVIDFNDLKG